jgi:hypothetical protein
MGSSTWTGSSGLPVRRPPPRWSGQPAADRRYRSRPESGTSDLRAARSRERQPVGKAPSAARPDPGRVLRQTLLAPAAGGRLAGPVAEPARPSPARGGLDRRAAAGAPGRRRGAGNRPTRYDGRRRARGRLRGAGHAVRGDRPLLAGAHAHGGASSGSSGWTTMRSPPMADIRCRSSPVGSTISAVFSRARCRPAP